MSSHAAQDYCGAFEGTSPNACPHCRDVPEADIDSPRTSWGCFCGGGCYKDHQEQCNRRQIQRTIVRIVSLQYDLALVLTVFDYNDVPQSDARSFRTIFVRCPQPRERTLKGGLPEEVKVQACCIENCVDAVATTAPILAWLIEGTVIKQPLDGASNNFRYGNQAREINVKPKPTASIAMHNVETGNAQHRASIHTILFIEPDTAEQKQNAGSSEDMSQGLHTPRHEDGRVSDPTFPQYGYDRNCHRISDYLREKTDNEPYQDLRLGFCSRQHDEKMKDEASDGSRIKAHVQDAAIRTVNSTVYREVQARGGPRGFLFQSSHEAFQRNHQHLIDTAGADLRQLRADIDRELFTRRSFVAMLPEIQRISQTHTSDGHDKIISAFSTACSLSMPPS